MLHRLDYSKLLDVRTHSISSEYSLPFLKEFFFDVGSYADNIGAGSMVESASAEGSLDHVHG